MFLTAAILFQDRRGLESNVLRFLGRMVTSKPIDQSRRFIISYFLSDDTILVFEPPVRNSGKPPFPLPVHITFKINTACHNALVQ